MDSSQRLQTPTHITHSHFSSNNQTSTSGSIKKVSAKKKIPQDSDLKPTQSDKKYFKDKHLSSEDRTVIEFSRFCKGFYNTGDIIPKLPEGVNFTPFTDPIGDFCKMMRVVSHCPNHISHIKEVTEVIKIDSYSDDKNKATLKRLIHLEKYTMIPDIDAARKMLPIRKRATPDNTNMDIENTSCRRSIRISSLTEKKDSKSPSVEHNSDRDLTSSESDSEVLRTQVKRRKITHQRKPDQVHHQQERIIAVKQIIELCLEKTTTKDQVCRAMKFIVDSSNLWMNPSSLQSSMSRWFYKLEQQDEMTRGFTPTQIKNAKISFSRLIGFPKHLTGKS